MNSIYPIGTVLKLKNSIKKVMIIGYEQELTIDNSKWDYSGVIFPFGYLGSDKNIVFNKDMIEKVYYIGYQNDDFEIKEKEGLEYGS